MVGTLMAIVITVLSAPLNGQSGGASRLSYDLTHEITVSGTVLGVLIRPAPGMIAGSHLLLTTVSGVMDAALGRWGLQGKSAPSVTPGRQIEVIGVMKVLGGKPVLLARAVKVDGKVYTIRNEFGIPVSPQAHERAAVKGESL